MIPWPLGLWCLWQNYIAGPASHLMATGEEREGVGNQGMEPQSILKICPPSEPLPPTMPPAGD